MPHPAILYGPDHGFHLFVESKAVVLQERLEPCAFDQGFGHSIQRVSQLLNFLVFGVVEGAGPMSSGSAVTELLPSLKGHFKVALALLVEPIMLLRGLKNTAGKVCAYLNVAIHIGRIDHLLRICRGIAALRAEMTAAVAVQGESPMRRGESWIGKVDRDDGIWRSGLGAKSRCGSVQRERGKPCRESQPRQPHRGAPCFKPCAGACIARVCAV